MIDSFLSNLAQFQLRHASSDPLLALRQKSWNQFSDVGLPNKKTETYQYLKLRKLMDRTLTQGKAVEIDPTPYIYPECKESYLVFVNGHYLENLSKLPEGIEILPLSEAIFSYGTWLNNQWARTLKEEKDPFALLNGALFSEGALIYIAPKKKSVQPIQLLFVTTEENTLSSPRVELFVGALSEASILSRHVSLTGNNFTNLFVNCHVEEGAKLTYTQSVMEMNNKSLWLFDAVRAHIKRDSSFTTHMATRGSETIRFDYQVELAGENSDCHLNGLFMLQKSEEAHAHVLMKHLAPHCRSLQLFKNALSDTSRSSFEGKIYVMKEAQKTDSFQLNNNLLLSDHAQANSKPNLEIFADDVKASHGATFGQLDPEEVFYLRSRGYGENEAKGLLTKAFLREVLAKVEFSSVKEDLLRHADNFLG